MRFAFLLLACALPGPAAARDYTLEAVGVEEAAPDFFHVMMKLEATSGLMADASVSGEKRLKEFLAAVEALGIPGLTSRVHNNLFTPAPGHGFAGGVYSRNVVFTIPDNAPPAQRNGTIARLQDLGAKYDSHCVTCIGSG